MKTPSSPPTDILADVTSKVNSFLEQCRNKTGGEKHQFIEENRLLIIEYHRQFGTDETLSKFQFKPRTLDSIIRSNGGGKCPRCGSQLMPDHDNDLYCISCGHREYSDLPEASPVSTDLRQSDVARNFNQFQARATRRMKELENRTTELEKLSDYYKIMLEQTREARNEETKKTEELHHAFYGFTADVSNYLAVGMKSLFKLMLDKGINAQKFLPPPVPKPTLKINNLILEGRKSQIRRGKQAPDNPLLETVVRIENKTDGVPGDAKG